MTNYTATRVFDKITGQRTLSVVVGTGSVLLEIEHSAGVYTSVENYAADTVKTLDFGIGRKYRFTVTAPATFSL